MENFKTYSYSGILTALLVATMVACGGNSRQEAAGSESADTTAQAMQAEAPAQKLNLNTATEEEFLTIPDVGDRMVHEFFEYRPYISIQQFRQEIGKYVDESQVAAYEQYVFVPIDRNESDAATLQQIPGLDETEATELINGRPYDSNQAFLDGLTTYVTEEELSVAKSYLAE